MRPNIWADVTTSAPDSPAAPEHSARPARALVSVVVALTVLNAITTWLWNDDNDVVQIAIIYGLFGFEPLAFGAWVALGDGSILRRLMLSAPLLMLLFVSPGYVPHVFDDVRLNEFTLMALMGFAMYGASAAIFLIFRTATGFRIRPAEPTNSKSKSDVQFSTRGLLALVTLYAVVMGFTAQLRLETKPRPNLFFGPDFFINIIIFGTLFLAGAVILTAIVPLAILHGRPTIRALALWASAWLPLTLLLGLLATWGQNDTLEFIGAMLLLQLCAATIGAMTALWLRYNGLRLVRPAPKQQVNSTLETPSP